MNSLLVIKPSSLGDIVHGLQVVQALVRGRPATRVTWVARDRFAPLVRAAPCVHAVIEFRRRVGVRGLFEVARAIRAERFDAVWDMQGLLRSGLMTAAARAPVKLGRPDAREGAGWFYRERIAAPEGPGPHHALDVLRPFLRAAGVPDGMGWPLELRRPSSEYAWHSFFGPDPALNFVIFPDSRGAGKEWPHFGAFTQLLLERIPAARVAWCAGARMEPPFAAPPWRLLNLTGCPLEEMIALVRQSSVFVGNDSGPMHLAAALGHRVLAIFGPSAPLRFGPYPLDAPHHGVVVAPDGVLRDLAPGVVFAALEKLRTTPINAASRA